MTIKRRLFISNILMIVIPLILSLAVFFGGLYVLTTVTGIKDDRDIRDGRKFFDLHMEMRDMAREWRAAPRDAARIARDVAAFNERRGGEWPLMLLYKDDELLVPPRLPDYTTALQQAMEREESISAASRMFVHSERVEDCLVVLMNAKSQIREPAYDYRKIMFYGTIFSVVCSVFIILLTNRFLTHFVFRSIVTSLDTLADGVQQIHDGNLDYRIRYAGNDEFAVICSDFNEMAARLQESVYARARGETSRRELLAGISHDLRTPLTSIKAYVEGIEKGVASDPAAQKRYLETIKHKAADLEHIIHMLFLFSKLDTGEFPYRIERTNLMREMAECMENFTDEYAEKGLSFEFRDDAPEMLVDIDVVQFRNVLANILQNSLKYSRKERTHVIVDVSQEGGRAKIVIADNGPGVPTEALDKLFDVFYRSDPSRREPGKGSGLGLAIAAKIIARFAGTIAAHNAPEGGLVIVVTLPIDTEGEHHG